MTNEQRNDSRDNGVRDNGVRGNNDARDNVSSFPNQAAKDAAIAKEKAANPSPTPEQSKHLSDLEAAEVRG